MVVSLKSFIENESYSYPFLNSLLSSFECIYNNEETADVINFLLNEAVSNEKLGISRTYLIISDEKIKKSQIQIDGYFSLSVKNIYFNKTTDENARIAITNEDTQKSSPAYLIGQLARGKYSPKGSGARYLKLALNYIANASEIVGGRLVYLDCSPDRQSYYENKGFAFLQNKHKSNLIQMYKII